MTFRKGPFVATGGQTRQPSIGTMVGLSAIIAGAAGFAGGAANVEFAYGHAIDTIRARVDKGQTQIKDAMKEAVERVQEVELLPIGSIVAWHNSIPTRKGEALTLPPGWVPCSGPMAQDDESRIDMTKIPDLNGERRFLRGSSKSGTNQEASMLNLVGGQGRLGSDPFIMEEDGVVKDVKKDHGQAHKVEPVPPYPVEGYKLRPVNMSVVWIMRVK